VASSPDLVSTPPSQRRGSASAIDAAWQVLGARLALGGPLVVCALVVVSWAAGWDAGQSRLDDLPPIVINAAVSIGGLAAMGLLGTRVGSNRDAESHVTTWGALAIAALAVATLVEHGFGVDLGVDAPFASRWAAVGTDADRMCAGTAIALALLAGGLLATARRRPRLGLLTLALGTVVGAAAVVAFLVTPVGRLASARWTPPVHTALLLALAGVGLVLATRARHAGVVTSQDDAVATELRRARPALVQTAAALLVGLSITALVVADVQRTLEAANALRFLQMSGRLTEESRRRVTQVGYGLRGLRGVFATHDTVSRRTFEAYVASRDLPKEFPGAKAMGFIARVRAQDVDAFADAQRAGIQSEFQIAPWHGTVATADDADRYIIQYLYPPAPEGRRVEGAEMSSDPVRRAALERAVRTGTATLTPALKIEHDEKRRPGVGYLLPVFRSGVPVSTPAEREGALVGVLYAPVVIDDALQSVTDTVDGALDLEIYEGDRVVNHARVFRHRAAERAPSVARRREMRTPIDIGGRTWTFVIRANALFEVPGEVRRATSVGVYGSLVSLLLALAVRALHVSRRRALALAEAMTGELRASEEAANVTAKKAERLAEIARRTSNAVVITDVAGRIEWVNEGFTRISGFTATEVIGRAPGPLLQGPASDPLVAARMGAAVRRGEGVTAEIVNYSKRGEAYLVSIEIVPLSDVAGVITGFMAIETDITERERVTTALHQEQQRLGLAVTELHAARARAEGANKAKSEFLANMSHEIRTPLTSILGFAELLREDGAGAISVAERGQAIDTIMSAGKHLLTVINDILDLSKIEADRMTVERIETPLLVVVREVESLMRPRAVAKGVTLGAVLSTPVPDRIVSDPTRLRQILMNIVGNAVKFTDTGSVTLGVAVAGGGVDVRLVIDVEDTGPGISEQGAANLFQAFGQADTGVTRKHGGTGLGLTICRRLAGLMGGNVSLLRSEVGRGSCFRVELPLEAAAGATYETRLDGVTDRQAIAVTSEVRLRGRVLLAEDGLDNQRLISFHLTRAGATVEIAENGVIALARIEAEAAAGTPYDLLLTDMQMPEMDGYSLARRLRADGSRLAIVALTAHAMAEDRARCLDAGCDDYAVKPVDRVKLIAVCGAWMSRAGGAAKAA
jgi:PAS domain S-box-containing protein